MAQTEFLLETAIARAIGDIVRGRAAQKLSEVLERARERGAGHGGMRPPLRPVVGRAPGRTGVLEEEAERAVAAALQQGVPVRLATLIAAVRSRGDIQTSADQALLALVRAAGHRVAVEVDLH
jgi:hypothetical protein